MTIEAGMNSFEFKYAEDVSEDEIIAKVEELNSDDSVHGILVQLPLPKHISEDAVISAISPTKDVDGFHVYNRGLLVTGSDKALVPCTPLGCLMMLQDKLGDLTGKNAVVIGKSNIVGKPMSQLLLNASCTVTTCHSKTKDIKDITKKADILVVAVGRPEMIDESYISEGCVIIDVGINRVDTDENERGYKLVGDVNFNSCIEKASAITPVPGGVGPMTIACLLNNTLKAYKFIESK
jgi:methylenetetrahydrofolate dehydrogenase (NADP+)/methenyltetrahydrofolate cyclohydrolase